MKDISRRSLLKTVAAATAAASLAGCSTGGDDTDYKVFNPANTLVPDKDVQIFHTTGAYNCGSRCVNKVHVKNGKIIGFTSAGDKPRGTKADIEAEYDSSTLGEPIELRACNRCYGGYQGVLYQPDRLKYPLMRIDPSKPKGDINNFKRVTWEEAIDAAAGKILAAYARATAENLPYAPVMFRYFGWPMVAGALLGKPGIFLNGNESFGGVDQGTFDTSGLCIYVNSRPDRFNTKFMITWALDVTSTTYHNIHTHFMNTKMKEKAHGDIPMVVISANCSNAAAMLSTGIRNYSYTINGTAKTVDIPAWIPIRPATDSALAIAMAYVIYKNNRYDSTYMSTGADRKCFGFFKGDSVVSQAPLPGGQSGTYPIQAYYDIPSSAPYNASGALITQGSTLNGVTFKVPDGESFEEYLLSREVEWGGNTGIDPISASWKYPQPATGTSAIPGDATYTKVLEYVTAVTGVPANIIEALAIKYSEYVGTESAAFIETGGGAQRAWNAGEWVWSMICLSSMCGYNEKKGGGMAGMSMNHFAEYLAINNNGDPDNRGLKLSSGGGVYPKTMPVVSSELSNWAHLVLTGKDHRQQSQLKNDFTYQTGQTLASGKIDIDVIFHSNLNNLHTCPNASKNAEAYKKVETFIVVDQVMTPTALMADIILPAATHLEYESYASSSINSVYIHREKVVDRLYDTKKESDIIGLLYDKLNAAIGIPIPAAGGVPFDVIDEAAYNLIKTTDYYKTHVQNIEIPTSAELREREDGLFLLETSKEKSLVPMKDVIRPGSLDTSTGFINFYSPLRAQRPAQKILPGEKVPESFMYYPGGWRNATACYQPLMQGRESFFEDSDPRKSFTGFKSPHNSRVYKLMYMTNKARHRAHTVFDNTAAIKDQFPQNVKMNPRDAAERGIKEGDLVYAYNDRGCIKVPAHLTHSIVPGVISVEHGAWYRAAPSERVKVWMQIDSTEEFKEVSVPVDVGGADNTLTNDFFGEDSLMCAGSIPAQSGPCEVSLTKPEDGGIIL